MKNKEKDLQMYLTALSTEKLSQLAQNPETAKPWIIKNFNNTSPKHYDVDVEHQSDYRKGLIFFLLTLVDIDKFYANETKHLRNLNLSLGGQLNKTYTLKDLFK